MDLSALPHRAILVPALLLLHGCGEPPPTQPLPLQDRPGAGPVPLPSLAPGPSGTSVSRFTNHGHHAGVSWFRDDGDGEISGYLHVIREGEGARSVAWLYYSISRCHPDPEEEWWWDCETLSEGSGEIPAGHLGAGPGGGSRLVTDTGVLDDFWHGAGEGIAIDVTWSPDGMYAYRSNGTSDHRFAHMRIRQSGTWTDASARAMGIVGSETLESSPWVWAHTGSSRGVRIHLERLGR
jgi:hypothetical protein